MEDLFTLAARTRASLPLDLLAALTLISVLPFAVVMTTSFARIVVVLSLVRSALGAPTLPPNAVLTGLALVLTLVVMTPTMQTISREALTPYAHGKLSASGFAARAVAPLRDFMLRQVHRKDLALFGKIVRRPPDEPPERLPLTVVVPAFVVGELRSAFAIGVALYLPFLAIDLAVAAILMGLGMLMLSPPIVSLPIKLLLFVSVDGWALVCAGVTTSFR
jgi:flagellar biosynthetic protein FliP